MFKVKLVAVIAALAVLLVACEGRPSDQPEVKIVKYNQIQDEKSYKLEFENSDGQVRTEAGDVRDETEGGIFVIGQYSYIGPDNKRYTVQYEAGKNGFRPKYFSSPL